MVNQVYNLADKVYDKVNTVNSSADKSNRIFNVANKKANPDHYMAYGT